MDPRTTASGPSAEAPAGGRHARRRPPVAARRPALYLSMAAAGALLVNVVVGTEPAAQAEAGPPESVSVAQELGLSSGTRAVDVTENLQPLEDLAASRSSREADRTVAAQAQAKADQAERDRQKAEAEAKAKAAARAKAAAHAKAAAQAAAHAKAAAQAAAAKAPTQHAAAVPAPASTTAPAGTQIAHITNSAGDVRPQVQAAANVLVSSVPGVAGLTLGGTRSSATDPHGHPSGLALDYMVLSDSSLGDAIVKYHIDHWNELGVEYLIWQQRYLGSPGGSWEPMSDRGSPTANHMDHVHVNYVG